MYIEYRIQFHEATYEDFIGNLSYDIIDTLPSLKYVDTKEGVAHTFANSLVDVQVATDTGSSYSRAATITITPRVSYGKEYLLDIREQFEKFVTENFELKSVDSHMDLGGIR